MPVRQAQVASNLGDYREAAARFSWSAAASAGLSGLPGGAGLNLAFEAVDRHAQSCRATRTAVRIVRPDESVVDVTYGELSRESNRFANVLAALGVEPGDTVATMCGRTPGLYVVALGTLKRQAVLCPLFTSFGPVPVASRLRRCRARVLVTTQALYQRKIAGIRDRLPHLRHVVTLDGGTGATIDLGAAMGAASDAFEIAPTDPETPAIVHFTSGTTGSPKGAVHAHAAGVVHHATAALALDLHDDDVYWCTADPGWVTGTSYGVLAPLLHGITAVVDEAEFEPERWCRILRDHRVTVWYTAPTGLRRLRRLGPEVLDRYRFPSLRLVASVGEPLDAETIAWGRTGLGVTIHDTWWQTETGGIMIANFPGVEVRPGSMGVTHPGITAAVLRCDARGRLVVRDGQPVTALAGEEGELALRAGWPSMFRGYVGDDSRYRACFAGGWYRSGDLVRRDADGYFWFCGRGDDVITSSGHLIGPFEVESTLLAHPAVSETAVIGRPDPVAGEVVKAFVVLAPGFGATEAVRLDLIAFARRRLGAALAPREVEFREELPKTTSGKTVRRLLKFGEQP